MHEDDQRWCGNLALGIGFFVAFFGVTLAQYMAEDHRCYVMVMSVGIGVAFAVAGALCHRTVWNKIQRTTIRRREDRDRDSLQALRRRSRNDRCHD